MAGFVPLQQSSGQKHAQLHCGWLQEAVAEAPVKKGRGRPSGSRTKPRQSAAAPLDPPESSSDPPEVASGSDEAKQDNTVARKKRQSRAASIVTQVGTLCLQMLLSFLQYSKLWLPSLMYVLAEGCDTLHAVCSMCASTIKVVKVIIR